LNAVEINYYVTKCKKTASCEKTLSNKGLVLMSPRKKENKINGFRPPIGEATDPSHDEHIRGFKKPNFSTTFKRTSAKE
jgi:hypothetical protein